MYPYLTPIKTSIRIPNRYTMKSNDERTLHHYVRDGRRDHNNLLSYRCVDSLCKGRSQHINATSQECAMIAQHRVGCTGEIGNFPVYICSYLAGGTHCIQRWATNNIGVMNASMKGRLQTTVKSHHKRELEVVSVNTNFRLNFELGRN